MKHLYKCCILFLFTGCADEPVKISQISPSNYMEVTSDEKPLFWQEICRSRDFSYMYDCNNYNCYQIELYNSPFKDFTVVTIDIRDSTKDIIFLNAFKKNNNKTINKNEQIIMINPSTKDTIKYFYRKTSKLIISPKDKSINNFLLNTIWRLPNKDGDIHLLDPEIWTIKARSGNREIVLNRHLFKDSIYYSNIQNILNICKIKDYKYKKR
jgi:hypothetical protein